MSQTASMIWGLWIIFSFAFSYKVIIRPVFGYSFRMPFIFHLFFLVTNLFFFYFILLGMWQTKDKKTILAKLNSNPCDENAEEFISFIRRVPINNHPSCWQEHREIWYFVNGKNTISTQTKQRLLDMYKKRGLHLTNARVIDNFKR